MSRSGMPVFFSSRAASRSSAAAAAWARRDSSRSSAARARWAAATSGVWMSTVSWILDTGGVFAGHDGDEVAGHGVDLAQVPGLSVAVDLGDIDQPEPTVPGDVRSEAVCLPLTPRTPRSPFLPVRAVVPLRHRPAPYLGHAK
jgi:hypothetical protein